MAWQTQTQVTSARQVDALDNKGKPGMLSDFKNRGIKHGIR